MGSHAAPFCTLSLSLTRTSGRTAIRNVLYLASLPVHSYVFHFLIFWHFLFTFSLFRSQFTFIFRAHPTALDGSSRATEVHAVRSFPRYPKQIMSASETDGSRDSARLTRRSAVGCRLSMIPAHLLLHRTAERAEITNALHVVCCACAIRLCFAQHFQLFSALALFCARALFC